MFSTPPASPTSMTPDWHGVEAPKTRRTLKGPELSKDLNPGGFHSIPSTLQRCQGVSPTLASLSVRKSLPHISLALMKAAMVAVACKLLLHWRFTWRRFTPAKGGHEVCHCPVMERRNRARNGFQGTFKRSHSH